MGSQRARDDVVRRALRRWSRGVHWVLVAGASGAMVAGGCGGSDQAQLQTEDTAADAATGTGEPGTSSADAVVTVKEAPTSEIGTATSTPLVTSTGGVASSSATTATTTQASRARATAGSANSVAPTAATTAPTAATAAPTAPTVGSTAPPSPQPQTITFPAPGGGQVKYAFERSIALGATASSGLPVEYSTVDGQCDVQGGSTVLLTGAGSCTVGAGQPGNAQWLPAQAVQVTFDILNGDSDFSLVAPDTVAAADLLVTLTLSNIVGSDSFTASGSGACPDGADITGSDSFDLSLGGSGTCTVTVSQNGNQDFNVGPTHTATITVT